MKKQYLISLLGLAAISVPVGSSLLETNTKLLSPVISETPDLNTGVIVEDTSKITVWDMDKKGEVNKDDQIQGFTFNTTYDITGESTTPGLKPDVSGGLNIYYGKDKTPDLNGENTNKEKFEVSYKELSNSEATIDGSAGTFELEANAAENTNDKYNQIWGKPIENADSFVVTMDTKYTEPEAPAIERPTRSTKQEVKIGEVGFADVLNNGSPGSIEPGKVKVTETTADVTYDITKAIDAKGEKEIDIARVEWVDGSNEEAPIFGEADPVTNGEISGTLSATGLDAGADYNNTNIKVTFIDGTSIFESVGDIKTDFEVKESTISQEGTVEVISQTEASVNFAVTPGQDKNGPVTVEEVRWMDGKKELANSNDDISDASDDLTSGTLTTNELNSYQKYNDTTLVADMSDGTNTNIVNVNEFRAGSAAETSLIEVGEVTTKKDSAKVSYDITPGKNNYGDDVTVKKVTWREADSKEALRPSEKGLVLATSINGENSGTLNAKDLELYTEYSGTIVEVLMSDGSKTSTEVKPFTTKSQAEELSTITANEVVTTETNATVSYYVGGYDNYGENKNVNEIEKVEWISKTNGLVIGSDESPELKKGNGTLTTDEDVVLKPYTSYDTLLIATYGDKTVETNIIFYTDPEVENPDIKVSDEVVISRNKDEATVDFSVDHGAYVDGTGATTEIEEIKWIAEDGETVLADEHETTSATNGKVTLGSITAVDLAEETDYNNTKLVVTMNDGSSDDEVVSDFTTKTDEVVEPVAPEVNEPTHVYTDTENNKIQVQGKVTPNDGTVTSVELLEGDKVVATDDSMSKARGDVSYDLVASDYSGNVEAYTIQVNYQDAEGNVQVPVESETIDPESNVIEEKDLGDGSVAPEVNEPTHVYTDTENNKIQVQGKVTPNDGTVTSVELLEGDKVVATDDSMSKARGDVSYDLVASDYSGNVEDYTIQVNYQDAEGNVQVPVESETIDPESNVIEEKDLGGDPIDPDEGDKTDKLGAGAVIGIIIAVLLGVGIIAWVGNLLYKKYNESKTTTKVEEKEQVEEKDDDQVEKKDQK